MLSLPLAKLSVAQDTDPAQLKFTWQHETQQIFFVLDSYGARDSFQLLKVVQGTQVRQSIEIERLINEGHELTNSMAERGVELKAEQLPVSAIVRCPLLAIRWQLPNKKIRRAQLKFKSSEDFDTAYNRLNSLGLRMSASGGSQAQTRPSTALPQQESSSSTKPSLIAAAYPHEAASGGLSCPPSRLAEISDRPYTAVNTPTFVESQLQETTHVRPVSACTGYSNEENSKANPFANPLAPPVYFPRPNSATTDILGSTFSNAVFPPRDRAVSTMEKAPSESNERPETAMLYNRPDTADSLLPPRRELPFQRSSLSLPRSSGSDSIRPSSRPSTALMGPPPLPARVATLRPSSSLGLSHDAELPPLPQPTFIGQPTSRTSAMHQLPRTPTQDHNPPVPGKTSPYQDSENQRFSSSRPSSSPLPSFQRTISSAIRPLSPLSGLAQNLRQATSQKTVDTSAPGLPHQGPAGLRNRHTFDPDSVGNLTAYTMQSEEGRRAALNEFIFRHLESDDFLTLVEDMETCWARVALGMQ